MTIRPRRNRRRSRSRSSSGSPSASPAIPATGCSSPGRSSPGPRRSSATTSARCRTSRPRSAPRPARCPASAASRSRFSSNDIHTPGDEPDVLVAMNPAALKTNIGDLPAGGALIVNSDAFSQANLNKAAYASNPLTDGSLKPYTVFEIPISTLNERSLEGLEMTSKQKDLTKNFFALGHHVLAVRALDGADDLLDRRQVRRPTGHRRGQQARPQGRLRVRRDDRDLPHPLPGQAGPARPRDVPQHHRQRGDGARLPGRQQARRSAAVLRLLPDHPGQRHPPPAVGLQDVRGQDLPGGGRDRGHRRGHRGELRRGDGHDRQLRPGHRPQVGGHGPGGHGRAAARRRRRPARRPVDRHAHQERAGRPAPGHVRAQLATRRCRSSRRRRPATASTWPSRPGGSPSST